MTATDITKFMTENEVEITPRDAALFIRPFDDDCNGKLNYIEFLYAFLSGRPDYRELVVQRLKKKPKAAINYISCNGTLKYETEFFIQRVIEEEVKLQLQLEKLRLELNERGDFSLIDLFLSL